MNTFEMSRLVQMVKAKQEKELSRFNVTLEDGQYINGFLKTLSIQHLFGGLTVSLPLNSLLFNQTCPYRQHMQSHPALLLGLPTTVTNIALIPLIPKIELPPHQLNTGMDTLDDVHQLKLYSRLNVTFPSLYENGVQVLEFDCPYHES